MSLSQCQSLIELSSLEYSHWVAMLSNHLSLFLRLLTLVSSLGHWLVLPFQGDRYYEDNYEGCDKHDTDTKSYHHQLIGFWWWLVWLVWRNKLTIVICYFLINRIIRFHVVRNFDISFSGFWFVAEWRFFINIGLFISVEISLYLCLCCLSDGCFFIRPRISGI